MNKTKEKSSVIYPVRVEAKLKKAFLATCEDNDQNGAQVIRNFMRFYISEEYQRSIATRAFIKNQ